MLLYISGEVLAVGLASGALKLLNTRQTSTVRASHNKAPKEDSPLYEINSFRNSLDAITDVSFSHDGLWMATADADKCVGLYRYFHRDEEEDKPVEWIYVVSIDSPLIDSPLTHYIIFSLPFLVHFYRLLCVHTFPSPTCVVPTAHQGKYRSHWKPIVGVHWEVAQGKSPQDEEAEQAAQTGRSNDSSSRRGAAFLRRSGIMRGREEEERNKAAAAAKARAFPRLYSLGEDRVLQEYDVGNSTIRQGLKLLNSTLVEQTATPTAFLSIAGTHSLKHALGPMGKGLKTHTGVNVNSEGLEVSPLELPEPSGVVPDSIITANDEYKMKVNRRHSNAPTSDTPQNNTLLF